MGQYKTPGVYVEEKNTFGSGIVANETAVPVFIGFTEKQKMPNGEDLPQVKGSPGYTMPVLVDSQLTYQQYFGGADTTGIMGVTEIGDSFQAEIKKEGDDYTPGFMYPSITNFFANGGGNCYIVSIGTYYDSVGSTLPQINMDGIKSAIEYAETSTLLVITDLIRYGEQQYYSWCAELLNFAEESKQQFLIMDVIQEDSNNSVYDPDDIKNFRNDVSSDYVKYGAAYFPYLKSLTPYAYVDENTTFAASSLESLSTGRFYYDNDEDKGQLKASYQSDEKGIIPVIKIEQNVSNNSIDVNENVVIISVIPTGFTKIDLEASWKNLENVYGWVIKFETDIVQPTASPKTISFLELNPWKTEIDTTNPIIVERVGGLATGATVKVEIETAAGENSITETNNTVIIKTDKTTSNELIEMINVEVTQNSGEVWATDYQYTLNPEFLGTITTVTMDLVRQSTSDNAKLNQVTTFLSQNYINIPPSPFMAGIYSRVDNSDGVWTSPANTNPIGVTGPLVDLTDKQQQNLNVDATSGKSVNAIRSFTGRGTLVWGARTTDGNSLDWRYINVRRLFISMETDISKALNTYVFQPNIHNTWVEVKMMIDAYLYGLFQQGAFAGETPEQSYQVLIGEGETMTVKDILDGYMKVSIRVAAVRPAEFIVLTFSQMMADQ